MSETPQRAEPLSRRPLTRHDAIAGAAVVGLALLARVLESVQQPLLFNDGPRFIDMAEAFQSGEWLVALSDAFHPLTAGLMAWVGSILGVSLEAAGQIVSVLAGGIAAWALWALARDQFGPRIALAAGVIFALQPRLVASSSGVQSDGLHIAWFLLAVLGVWRAASSPRLAPALGAAAYAGAFTGLAYLTRPEGLVVAAVFGPWLAIDALQRRIGWRRAFLLGASFGAVLLVVAAPYLLVLRLAAGEWTLTRKKLLSDLDELPSVAAPADLPGPLERPPSTPSEATALPEGWIPAQGPRTLEPEKRDGDPGETAQIPADPPTESPMWLSGALASLGSALIEVGLDGLRAVHTPALLLILLGASRAPPARPTRFLLGFIGVFLVILIGLHLHSGYISRRHWLPCVALLSPYIARGGLRLLDALTSVPWLRMIPHVRGVAVAAIVLAFLGHAGIPQADPQKIARQRAALWLKKEAAPQSVAAHRARDAHFAGAADFIPLTPVPAGAVAMLEQARASGARFALVDEDHWDDPEPLPPWLRELTRISYRGRDVLVLGID